MPFASTVCCRWQSLLCPVFWVEQVFDHELRPNGSTPTFFNGLVSRCAFRVKVEILRRVYPFDRLRAETERSERAQNDRRPPHLDPLPVGERRQKEGLLPSRERGLKGKILRRSLH